LLVGNHRLCQYIVPVIVVFEFVGERLDFGLDFVDLHELKRNDQITMG